MRERGRMHWEDRDTPWDFHRFQIWFYGAGISGHCTITGHCHFRMFKCLNWVLREIPLLTPADWTVDSSRTGNYSPFIRVCELAFPKRFPLLRAFEPQPGSKFYAVESNISFRKFKWADYSISGESFCLKFSVRFF